MTGLDADRIRAAIDDATRAKIASFDVFDEIESTNSYLIRQAAPQAGWLRVAVTDSQTAGRGRRGRSWQSPAGSGIALSLAYTFVDRPGNLPAVTLAIGLGAIRVLDGLRVRGVQLKWPNDLVLVDGKLGGILTEAKGDSAEVVTIVTGIGLNVDLGDHFELPRETGRVQHAVDLRRYASMLPDKEAIVAGLVDGLYGAISDYERRGLEPFRHDWQTRDWLYGRDVTVDTGGRRVRGVGAGIARNGALLIDTASGGIVSVVSGTVVMAGSGRREA